MIQYKEGYKYQLVEDYGILTNITPHNQIDILTKYIHLFANGKLIIKSGYAWDGPSGPTIDTPNFMRGALVHDALYQLMRMGHLFVSQRDHADRLLQQICIEDGMSKIRAWYVYKAVRWFAYECTMPKNRKKIIKIKKGNIVNAGG